MHHRTADEIDILEIAAQLRRDPRTVRKVVRGERIRGRIATAEILRALDARLIDDATGEGRAAD